MRRPLRIAPHTFGNTFIELADFVNVTVPGPLLHDWLLLWPPSVVVSQGVLDAAPIRASPLRPLLYVIPSQSSEALTAGFSRLRVLWERASLLYLPGHLLPVPRLELRTHGQRPAKFLCDRNGLAILSVALFVRPFHRGGYLQRFARISICTRSAGR